MGSLITKLCNCNSSAPYISSNPPSSRIFSGLISDSNGSNISHQLTLKDFVVEREVGKGGFGKVLLVRKINDPLQKPYAMKILRKADLLENRLMEGTILEKNILQKTHHPFVVHLNYAFQTDNKIYLVMEYLPGGDVYQLIKKNLRLCEETACFYIAEVILALEYLHKDMNLIYRDLKPENILLTSGGHIKLTDFGLSKQTDGKTYTFAGTPEYLAPEILLDTGQTKAVDWWGVGVWLYEMFAGTPPFSSKDKDFDKIKQMILENNPRYPSYFSESATSIIKRFLQTEPNKRLGVRSLLDIKKHPFFHKINWEDLFSLRVTPPYIGPGNLLKNGKHGHQLKESYEGNGLPRLSGITYNPDNGIIVENKDEETNGK